jgi:hypothetical protein
MNTYLTNGHCPIIRAEPFDIDANTISKEDYNSRDDYKEERGKIGGETNTFHRGF